MATNHTRVARLIKENGRVVGVLSRDQLGGNELEIRARVVINATGIFSDEIRRLDERAAAGIITTSQGIHLVLPRRFMPGADAMMIPKTHDGRVLFIIPWHDHLLVGTTDTARDQPELEPRASSGEIGYLLGYLNRYLDQPVGREDILSTFAGLRPLVAGSESSKITSRLSRDYHLQTSRSGLVTLAGGKWTTYRAMGEAAIDEAERVGDIDPQPSVTALLKLHDDSAELKEIIKQSPGSEAQLHPDYPWNEADIIHAARNQFANHVEDTLSRRLRALPLNAQAAREIAPRVAELMAAELGHDTDWAEAQTASFSKLAECSLP